MASQDFVRQLDEPYGFSKEPHWSEKFHVDIVLLGFLMILCGAGLFILYSASGQNTSMVIRQALYMVVGIVGMLVIAQIPPRMLMRMSPWIYAGGVGLLLGVLLLGIQSKGAQRWIQLPGFSLSTIGNHQADYANCGGNLSVQAGAAALV